MSQSAPSATDGSGRFSWTLGVGVNPNYDVDWGRTRMLGGTFWTDLTFKNGPFYLRGLGAEIEARDVHINKGDKPANYRQDVALAGVIYKWPHFQRVTPFGTYLAGLGSIDFVARRIVNYTHDTRTVHSYGMGLDVKISRRWGGRAEYEYQFWPEFLGGTINAQGLTFGGYYEFFPGRSKR